MSLFTKLTTDCFFPKKENQGRLTVISTGKGRSTITKATFQMWQKITMNNEKNACGENRSHRNYANWKVIE